MIPGARLILLGRQGAGKGTQCIRLSRHFVVPHISTGEMLRAAVREGTELGAMAKQVMDRGGLVGDEIMVGIVRERLAQPDAVGRGYILDGFPRTVVQAEGLSRFAAVDVAIDLVVPEEVVLERMSSRRVCSSCGRVYSLAQPPASGWNCDACGSEVVQRTDDTPEAIAKRLATYASETQPTIDWYRDAGLLIAVDGLGTPDEVTGRLLEAIDTAVAAR